MTNFSNHWPECPHVSELKNTHQSFSVQTIQRYML